jgi:hypothetical protein
MRTDFTELRLSNNTSQHEQSFFTVPQVNITGPCQPIKTKYVTITRQRADTGRNTYDNAISIHVTNKEPDYNSQQKQQFISHRPLQIQLHLSKSNSPPPIGGRSSFQSRKRVSPTHCNVDSHFRFNTLLTAPRAPICKRAASHVITEDRLTAVAPVHDVINRSWILHSQLAGHNRQSVPPRRRRGNRPQQVRSVAGTRLPSRARPLSSSLPRRVSSRGQQKKAAIAGCLGKTAFKRL